MKQPPVRWAPRLQPQKLRRLYERDAHGIVDAELIDEVGYTLHARCRSILHVADAMQGRVHCPECDTIISTSAPQPDDPLRCPQCGWETTWQAYANTYRTQELGAGGAGDIFSDFVRDWEQASDARSRMLLIDQLIHRWHWETASTPPPFGLGRPTGLNLIEGNRAQVLELLDTLTYGTGSTADPAAQAAWRARREEVRQRSRGDS